MRADGSIGIPLYDTSVLVRQIAALLAAEYQGDSEREIHAVAPLESAAAGDLSFVGSRKLFEAAQQSSAGCLIATPEYPALPEQTVVRSPQPRAAFAAVVAKLYPDRRPEAGVHPTAVIGAGARIHPSCSIAPYVTVGAETEIGEGTIIGPGCAIGERVQIGKDSRLHGRVTIYADVRVGARAVLHSGCVIGADGFGFALAGDRYQKFPQVGRVELGDDVEIGRTPASIVLLSESR